MEVVGIAIGILGIALTVLGIILARIWKGNTQMQKIILETIEEGRRDMAKMFKEIASGQKDIAQMSESITSSQKEIAQMLFNQTRILEKMEARMAGI